MSASKTGLESPVVNKNNSVTLNLKSEDAKKVEVSSELVFEATHATTSLEGILGGRIPLEKKSDNVWTITSIPMLPGIYAYSFYVNGLQTLDPLNPLIRRVNSLSPFGGSMNKVEIPAEKPMPWNFSSSIAHGTVVMEKFYSETFKQVKGCTIYLPPNYRPSERYPILYLLHGARGDCMSWIFSDYADNVLDNLISEKKAKETIVAMPDGHKGTVGSLIDIGLWSKAHDSEEGRRNLFEEHMRYFVNDVIPFVESKYRVLERAISGLSMGGGQTLNMVTTKPTMFTAAGMFSSGMIDDSMLERFSDVTRQLREYKLIYVSCGRRDPLLKQNEALKRKLDELGIQHTYYTDDTGHVNNFWSRSLADFLSRLQ